MDGGLTEANTASSGPISQAARTAAVGVAAVVVTTFSLHLLYLKWISLDRAVFEADVYAQGILRAWTRGSFWPWDLTEEFWPFLTMAPGIYPFVGLFHFFPGGYATLTSQALAMGASALVVLALARRRAPAGSWAPELLALTWLLHPVVGVAMGWGWCFYTFGAPLVLLGAWALDTRRWGWAAFLLLGAASMKVNVALGVGGLGLWAMLRRDRPWGVAVLLGAGAWIAFTGSLFLTGLLAEGRLSHDLHLGGASGPTASGVLTLAATVGPLLPLALGAWPMLLLTAGLELTYTTFVNPANSGLVGATAFVVLAAIEGLGRSRRPAAEASVGLLLALVLRLVYAPPVVSPLPLTPGAFTYPVDADGPPIRAAAEALGRELPADATLLVSESLAGAIGRFPGRIIRLHQWRGEAVDAVLLREPTPPPPLARCGAELLPARDALPAVVVGRCP